MKENLAHKGINPNGILCPRCYTNVDTANHYFMNCWQTRYVSFDSQLNIQINNIQTNLTEWCIDNIIQMGEDSLDKFINLLDGIQMARNKSIFEKTNLKSMKVTWLANKSFIDFKAMNSPDNQKGQNNMEEPGNKSDKDYDQNRKGQKIMEELGKKLDNDYDQNRNNNNKKVKGNKEGMDNKKTYMKIKTPKEV